MEAPPRTRAGPKPRVPARSLSPVFDRRRWTGSGGKGATVGKINVEWHTANRMPARATLDPRVAWHLSHLKACACQSDLPATILTELKRRGIEAPRPKAG